MGRKPFNVRDNVLGLPKYYENHLRVPDESLELRLLEHNVKTQMT
jgi:hypothetical protein